MTRPVANELPETLHAVLDGSDLPARVGETFLLLTGTADGYPHVALLSVGEVFAPSAREVRLALWPKSATTSNLTRSGRATLAWITRGAAYYLKLAARRVADDPSGLARFVCAVDDVRVDVVGYAEIASGITYALKDRDAVLARWQRQLEGLRAIGPAPREE